MNGSASGFTRIPPHSIEAEESVIGGVLLDNEAFDRVADVVKPEDFYVERHARICSAMAALSDSAMPMDAVTIAERLRQRGELERIGGVGVSARALRARADRRQRRALRAHRQGEGDASAV